MVHDRHRSGLGTRLLGHAAQAVAAHGGGAVYLWVLRQNTAARQFYRALGAQCVQEANASPPGGDPSRLIGTPGKLRMAWSEASRLIIATDGP